jgi:hypothetical protein
MTVASRILSENGLSFSSKPGVEKWDLKIYPKILLMMSSVGVYIVIQVKFLWRRRSTVNEPDLWLRQEKKSKSWMNFLSYSCYLLKMLP